MIKLTNENAIELNALFEKLLNWKGEKSLAYINVFIVAKTIDILKDKPEQYIRSLLYLARQEQKKIPELFSGDTLIALTEPSVRDFLGQGGFLTLYKKSKSVKRKDDFRFWLIAVVTIVTLFITVDQAYFANEKDQSKDPTEKQLKKEQPPLNQDSTKKENPKTIPKNDSIKK